MSQLSIKTLVITYHNMIIIIAILNIHTGKRGKLFVLSSNRALVVAHQVCDHLHTFEFKSYARCSTSRKSPNSSRIYRKTVHIEVKRIYDEVWGDERLHKIPRCWFMICHHSGMRSSGVTYHIPGQQIICSGWTQQAKLYLLLIVYISISVRRQSTTLALDY